MNNDMLEATRLTRAGQLGKATALLQRLLRGVTARIEADRGSGNTDDPSRGYERHLIDVTPTTIELPAPHSPSISTPTVERDLGRASSERTQATRRRPMPEALTGFLERTAFVRKRRAVHEPELLPDGAQFLERSYSNRAGGRSYKLYIPSGYHGEALPLIVMLHGCTQSPDDFAAGTRMNLLAEEHTCLVAYPAQPASANPSKCWNWFSARDQQRGQGEPALVAGITQEIMSAYSVDPRRVYVAGLSAGAAAAAIMGVTYPDLYAAVGVHSGLACGAARDLPTAFAAMRQGSDGAPFPSGGRRPSKGVQRIVPTIVFHGDCDTTVNPRNGDHVITQSSMTADLRRTVQHGESPGGLGYSRTLYSDASGNALLEQWVIRGAGHAWSGGSPAGSYTDPLGPDASREMLRFFLAHPR